MEETPHSHHLARPHLTPGPFVWGHAGCRVHPLLAADGVVDRAEERILTQHGVRTGNWGWCGDRSGVSPLYGRALPVWRTFKVVVCRGAGGALIG